MAKNLLYDGVMGKVYHDDAKDVIIKECTPGTLDLKSLRHYMEFQKTTPHVVKVLDLIDENTYIMERLKIVCTLLPLLSYHRVEHLEDFDNWMMSKIHNPQYYNHKELSKIIDTSSVKYIMNNFKKENLFDLIKTVNDVHSSSLEYSKKLPGNFVFTHNDFKLQNVALIKNPDSGFIYKVIDPNSWGLFPGFHSIETYYHTQIHLAFITQAMLRDIFT